jgi:tetratricopeptide (TPR) repeat protein
MLATTRSRYTEAAQHFEQALTLNERIRSPLWIAHSQHDFARMLLVRNEAGDRSKALKLLQRAVTTAEELGLKALADKARPLRLMAEASSSSKPHMLCSDACCDLPERRGPGHDGGSLH